MKMKKLKLSLVIFFILLFADINFSFAQPETSKISSSPGAFSRMGFGARGMAMGNAMTSVISGSVSPYYNPSLNAFVDDNLIHLGYSFLALDRKLNFVQLSKKVLLYKRDELGNKTDEVYSSAGISVGLINSSVDNIDGRDRSGIQTKTYSTSENQFFLSVSISPFDRLTFGITSKYYHYSLFEKVSSKSLGFDFGMIYRAIESDKIGKVVVGTFIGDINSKYRWDTTPVYEQEGKLTIDKFPLLTRIGVSYYLPNENLIAALDFESTNLGTKILRFGTELVLIDFVRIRLGIDRLNLENSDMIPKISLGFGLRHNLYDYDFELNYAFVTEPYSPMNQHIISLGVKL